MSPSKRLFFPQEGNRKPVIIDGIRSPFVKSFGEFAHCDALEIFAAVTDALIRKTDIDPIEIDEINAGIVLPQSKNMNVARDAVIALGLPHKIVGSTTNFACASSLVTITAAAKTIKSGDAQIIFAGGVECLSDPPIFYSRTARSLISKIAKSKNFFEKIKSIREFSFFDWIPTPPSIAEPLTGLTMGQHAEIMAKLNSIARHEQDLFALSSHINASRAMSKGILSDEITNIWPKPVYNRVSSDNLIRPDASLEGLGKLKPVFDKNFGTITAGNSSAITDGAAITMIADEKNALKLGLIPKASIVDFCFVGVDPSDQLLIGPAIAIPLLLKRNRLTLEQIDLFEIHEAFAAQVLSCFKCLESAQFNSKYFGENKPIGSIPSQKINVNGGSIAIGHPFGATGSRMINTLTNELYRLPSKRFGIVAICTAGGMAGAVLLERYC